MKTPRPARQLSSNRLRTSPLLTLPVLLYCLAAPTGYAAPKTSRPLVVASSFHLAALVDGLAAGLVEVDLLELEDPAHAWPNREQVLRLQAEASLVLVNGVGFEPWLETVALPRRALFRTGRALRQGGDLLERPGAAVHGHGAAGRHSHAAEAGHTWLDPELLLRELRAVETRLRLFLPGASEVLAANAATCAAALQGLAEQVEKLAAAVPKGTVLAASHPAYDYLGRRLGTAIHSLHLEPEDALTPDDLAELQGLGGRGVMLWEGPPQSETVELLRREAGLTVVVLDPLERRPEGQGCPFTLLVNTFARGLADLDRALAGLPGQR
ncbi:MAG: hypothetical protein A2284_02760 [Deltaproteobacteria bacterium RIFOXYA12_FULL_61_11]|nr:MAG: hypothetical protein A2284_02760 [Deltaproteobacteria bacterium RIFOXYA12_FULL_61_11]